MGDKLYMFGGLRTGRMPDFPHATSDSAGQCTYSQLTAYSPSRCSSVTPSLVWGCNDTDEALLIYAV